MRSKFDVFCIYKKKNVKSKGVGVVRSERAEIKTNFFTNKLIYQQEKRSILLWFTLFFLLCSIHFFLFWIKRCFLHYIECHVCLRSNSNQYFIVNCRKPAIFILILYSNSRHYFEFECIPCECMSWTTC